MQCYGGVGGGGGSVGSSDQDSDCFGQPLRLQYWPWSSPITIGPASPSQGAVNIGIAKNWLQLESKRGLHQRHKLG